MHANVVDQLWLILSTSRSTNDEIDRLTKAIGKVSDYLRTAQSLDGSTVPLVARHHMINCHYNETVDCVEVIVE